MSRFNFEFSIRAKLGALLFGVVGLGIFAQAYFGSTLLINDKASYIFQHNLAALRSVGENVDRRINDALTVIELTAPAADFAVEGEGDFYKNKPFEARVGQLGVGAIAFGHPNGVGFELKIAQNKNQFPLAEQLAKLGWTPDLLHKARLLAAITPQKNLIIGKEIGGSDIYFPAIFAELGLDKDLLKDIDEETNVNVIDAAAEVLQSNAKQNLVLSREQTLELKSTFRDPAIQAGVKRWNIAGQDYIVCYQKIAEQQLMAVSYVPYSVAFAAARAMIYRSVLIGLCIFLIAIGLGAIFIQSLNNRLRQLWEVTQKVAAGEFSVRVEEPRKSKDELGALAGSFNTMAQKIEELIVETAEKARMEKELETAQALQSRFFPQKSFSHRNLSLSGKYHPSTECAGDWWDFVEFQNRVVFVIGDVTGHGASSALVTAAAHGVFHHVFHDQAHGQREFSLKDLIVSLNATIFSIGKGDAMMTLVAAEVDLNTGAMKAINAGHPSPFLGRKKQTAAAAGAALPEFSPISASSSAPLGFGPSIEIVEFSLSLEPGDSLVLYTDGFFEPRTSDGKKINKRRFLDLISRKLGEVPAASDTFCDRLIQEVVGFYTEAGGHVVDDVTMILVNVPGNVLFENAKAPEAMLQS